VPFTDCNGALRGIALGVCDYLAESTKCPGQLAQTPLEGSIIPVVEGMFMEGLAKHAMAPDIDSELRGYRQRNGDSPGLNRDEVARVF
jgi:hypothetical protein